MIRLFLVVILLLGYLILTLPILGILWIWKKYQPDKAVAFGQGMVRGIFKLMIFATGAKVDIKGKENLPSGAALYVSNHRGYFDILLGYSNLVANTGFVAKKEMEKIPVLAHWMRFLNCLFLDRSDLKKGMQMIVDAIELNKKGISIWICPEGTRDKDAKDSEVGEFKEGALKIAEKSGVPIIPVAIYGTNDILERQFPKIKAADCGIIFGEAIYVKDLEPEVRKKIGAYTREKIQEMLRNR